MHCQVTKVTVLWLVLRALSCHPRPATVMFLVCEKTESVVVSNNTVPMITFFMRLFFMKQNVCFYTVSFDKLSMEKFNED